MHLKRATRRLRSLNNMYTRRGDWQLLRRRKFHCDEFLVDADHYQLLLCTSVVTTQRTVDVKRIVAAARWRNQSGHDQAAHVTENFPGEVGGNTPRSGTSPTGVPGIHAPSSANSRIAISLSPAGF